MEDFCGDVKELRFIFDLMQLWHHYVECKNPPDTENDVFLVSSSLFPAI